MTATTSSTTSKATRPQLRYTLDDLLDLDVPTLQALYEGASVPKIGDLHGDLRGKMLTSPLGGKGLARVMRSLGGWERFPWRGKSFTPHDDARGEGINRVFTDRNKLFRFDTFIGKSRAGAFDALQLDYDNPKNPPFIRIIKDEVRTLRPGLFLGQAWIVARKKETLGLYFALAMQD